MLKLKLIQSTDLFMWALVRIGATSSFKACASIEENIISENKYYPRINQSSLSPKSCKEWADKNLTTMTHLFYTLKGSLQLKIPYGYKDQIASHQKMEKNISHGKYAFGITSWYGSKQQDSLQKTNDIFDERVQ